MFDEYFRPLRDSLDRLTGIRGSLEVRAVSRESRMKLGSLYYTGLGSNLRLLFSFR